MQSLFHQWRRLARQLAESVKRQCQWSRAAHADAFPPGDVQQAVGIAGERVAQGHVVFLEGAVLVLVMVHVRTHHKGHLRHVAAGLARRLRQQASGEQTGQVASGLMEHVPLPYAHADRDNAERLRLMNLQKGQNDFQRVFAQMGMGVGFKDGRPFLQVHQPEPFRIVPVCVGTRQREVLHLKEIEGYPTREIAAMLGCDEEQVRVILSRGRMALRGILQKMRNDERTTRTD